MSLFKERIITGVCLVATVSALFGLGYGFGKDTNESLLSFLREKNQEAEKTENRLRAEISSLKLELLTSKKSGGSELAAVDKPAEGGVIDSKSAPTIEPVKPSFEVSQIDTQSTSSFFDGKVFVSLVGISYEGNPTRHKVVATIGAPGKQSVTLEKVDVGSVTVFEGYEIRLVASDTFTATFSVTRLDSKT
ncbi:hypothetical protein VW6S_22 [Pseudomonas phage VW-6S]|nr:hypothetical protein VW6S_22 [Pseudomonas phage VW-6S]